MFSLILLCFAFTFAAIAAFWNPQPESPLRVRLIAAALCFFFAACILGDKLISSRIGN